MRPGGEVVEQGLHVARASLAAVDAIGAAVAALDPAADLKLRGLVERWRRNAGGLIEVKRDLGEIA